MGDAQKILIICFFTASAVAFVAAVVSLIWQFTGYKWKSAKLKLLFPTVFLMLGIFLLRFATAFYGTIFVSESIESEGLNWFEGLLDSFAHTMQTFSLDESYTETITTGKALFLNEFGSRPLAELYGIYSAVLNTCALSLGVALLLGIIASFFPQIRLAFHSRGTVYVFSQLNEKAVCLAEDIAASKSLTKKKGLFGKAPLVVFTGTYVDNEDEVHTELVQKAKGTGAVCIKDDITQLHFLKTGDLNYMLIAETEMSNLQTLAALTKEGQSCWNETDTGLNTTIYVYAQNDDFSSGIKKIYQKIDERLSPEKQSSFLIVPVREYTSMIYSLFDDVPLYYPLLNKYAAGHAGEIIAREKELAVTIIGEGIIAREAFLAVYWYGQIPGCKLTINVVSEDADAFRAHIDRINPEILRSGITDGKTGDRELLRIYPNRSEFAPPYAAFNFYDADITAGNIQSIMETGDDGCSLCDSDYFVIAPGPDDLNIGIALEINKAVRRRLLKKPGQYTPVIAYAVQNSEMNSVLNDSNTRNRDTYLYAFAAMGDIYSYKNIFGGENTGAAFLISKSRSDNDRDMEKKKFMQDEYSAWSSIARALHLKYKMYSLGLLDDEPSMSKNTSSDAAKRYLESKKRLYWDVANSTDTENLEKCGKLAWLEHRRWNAFLRSKGFVAPSAEQFEKYAYSEKNVDHKHIELRLHPCIVECSTDGKIKISDKDWDSDTFADNDEYDFLNIVSIAVYRMRKERKGEAGRTDYIVYDYPAYEKEYPGKIE